MGTNSESDSVKVVRYCRIGCSDFIEQIRRVLKRSNLDPFKIQKVVEDILVETFIRCFGGTGSTILDILEDLRHHRIDRRDMIDVLIEFEDFVYKDKTLCDMRRFTVVDAKFIYDTPLLEVEYHETVPKEEPMSFTRFIRRQRQAGELIHPEVEKALESFQRELDHSSTIRRPSRVSSRHR
jgi:hypothetical protein